MADGGRKLPTLDVLIDALDKRERAPSNVPKVETFHFKGDRVSDWLDLTEQALVGLSNEVKLQRVLRYVLHSHHREVTKVVDAASDSSAKVGDLMRRKYRLGDGLLTMADLEAMNKKDFSTIGAFVHKFKKKARKVHGISEEAQCATFLGLLTSSETTKLTKYGEGSERLTRATIDKGVEEGGLDQVEQHQMRLQRRKRKERDATASGTPGVKRIVTDVKRYAVRLEEGFDVERMVDKLLEGHNDLMNVKDILTSAPRLCGELKGRLSRRLVPNVHLSSILPREIEWTEAGTRMDWKCVACGLVDLKVRGQPSIAMVDMGEEMNIIRERDATMLGLEVDHSDYGVLHGANCKDIFCGTASNVMVEIGRVRARTCFVVMPDVDHPILLGRSFLCRTETLVFNRHEGTMILALSDPVCGNYEIIKCRNRGPGSGRNRLNLGSFTFEESEYARRRFWEEQEEEGAGEVLSLSLNDVNKAMEVVAAHDMADPEAIKALREQVPESPQDLQRLNAVTVRDARGLPNADALSESCAGRPIISLIDLYFGYDQFPVYPPDRPVTAMHTPRWLIHMNVAPQGWTNAVAMVQRHMIKAMQTVSSHITQPYIDDLAVKGPKEKEEDEVMPGVKRFVWKHIQDIDQVLGLLEEHNLTASGPKSKHCMREATILGFVCNEQGRRPDVKKTDKILEWPVPFQSITDVRSFLGMLVLEEFCEGLRHQDEAFEEAGTSGPGVRLGEDQEKAVERMTREFKEGGLVLGAPNYEVTEEKPFVVETDAGRTTLGGVLIQADVDGKERLLSEELRPPSPLPSTQELDIPRETPFRSLATHLDVSQWEASRLGEGSVEPTRYVPLEEPLDPEMETDMRDREEPQDPEMATERPDPIRPQGREVIMVGDDTPPCSPTPEPAQRLWPEGIPEPGSEEIPESSPAAAITPEQKAEAEDRGVCERARVEAPFDLPSATQVTKSPDIEEPVSADLPPVVPCASEGMEVEASTPAGQRPRVEGTPRETREEKSARVRVRLDEIHARQAEMEAAGIEPTPPVEPKMNEQRINELWARHESERDAARQRSREAGRADEETSELREMGDLGFSATRHAIERMDRRIGRAGADGEGRGMRASPSQGATVEVPRQSEPMEEVPLDAVEEEGGTQESLMAMSTKRRGSRLHELAATMGIGTPQERSQRLDAPEQTPRLGELRAELGFWATETNSGGPDSRQQQQQEVMSMPTTMVSPQPSESCGDEVVVETKRAHEEGPRESDMPDDRPGSTAARRGGGVQAMEPGPQGHMGSSLCREVTTRTIGAPSASSSQGRKKKTARWHDTSCFWCKEGGHRAVDCPELLEDKAEGRVAEVDDKFYDRQGRIVERAPDGGRDQLYRQNQEELCK
ncbi:hypothetical protein CBR_g20031 [Chara braunii]|uniref:CCHC-type domain-containing protein n=1 Tax=Chara braunii TaxID=69332 RepID=A0A388KZE5_CHABU|nr:hypothetical protein CBR_g20031 [Chara braunii]|eukprot:GBG75401.1 hypothetical protein CBR_g20031 [Chara braunii]